MDDDKPKDKSLFSRLTGKLAVLVGSGLAILNGVSTLDTKVAPQDAPSGINVEAAGGFRTKALAQKLVLKQTQHGVRLIQQHDSHSSHSSHDSHSSHSSHSSHDSHASHSSHASGGFV
jgi:hypothetical protein